MRELVAKSQSIRQNDCVVPVVCDVSQSLEVFEVDRGLVCVHDLSCLLKELRPAHLCLCRDFQRLRLFLCDRSLSNCFLHAGGHQDLGDVRERDDHASLGHVLGEFLLNLARDLLFL